MANFSLDTNISFGTDFFGYDTVYSVQSVNLPGIVLGHVELASRYDVLQGKTPGRNLEYNSLTMNIICDEKMEVWTEIMKGILSQKTKDSESDGWLSIHDSTGKTIHKVVYKNILPVSVSDLEYSTTTENDVLTFSLEVVYDYFEIIEVVSLRDSENEDLLVEKPTEVEEPEENIDEEV